MNEEQTDRKPNILERAIELNRKIDYYWFRATIWFWGILALFIVLTICNSVFSAIGL